jgi:hypothetical protein
MDISFSLLIELKGKEFKCWTKNLGAASLWVGNGKNLSV